MILCVVMFLTCGFTNVISAKENDIMFDLTSLGIIGSFGFEEHLDSNITRAEFAQLVVNMINQKQVANTMETANYFTDIADTPYKGAINLLYKMEIISGTSKGIFEPDRNVRYSEACKMLVKALGYHVIVSDTSLDSYTFLAGTIGVTKNVDSSKEYITVRDMLVMVDNCLDIGKMVPMYYNDDISPSYVIDEDDTFRNDFERPALEGTVKLEGIVTADVSEYLYTNRDSLKDTQLEISGEVFDFGTVAPLGFVGKHVCFYVSIDNEGEYGNVVSIAATNENNIMNINGADIVSTTKNTTKFLITDTKTTEIDTDFSTKWIYNGVPGDYILNTLDKYGNVQITAIDNNQDEIYDVVHIWEYEDGIVESVNKDAKTVAFMSGYYYKKDKYIILDEESENINVGYFDKDGNTSSFDAINEGSVLSIAKSSDGKKYRIVICDDGGIGLVESKDDDYITMGDSEYKCLNLEPTSMKIGRNYEYKINFMNRLIWADEIEVESDYAYVYQISGISGLNTPKIKLIIPEYVTTKTTQQGYNEDTDTSTSTTNMYIRNNSILVYNLANKVTIEYWTTQVDSVTNATNRVLKREKVTPNAEKLALVMGQPVSFEVDDKNSIVRLSAVTPSSVGGPKLKYNSNEMVFGGKSGKKSFGIDNETYAVCVPTNDASEDDMLNYIQELLSGNEYAIDAYDVDEDTHIADLLVINAEMISGSAGNVAASRNYVGMVKKAARVYDEENDSENIKITMLTKGNETIVCEQSFIVSPLISNYSDFYQINAGDLMLYSLDGFDRLNGFEMLRTFGGYYDGDTGVITGNYTVCGTVTDIDYDEISDRKVRWADILTLETTEGKYVYELYHNTSLKPTVYILNSNNRDVQLGAVSDIRYGDRVLVYAYADDPYAVVIYR